MNPTYSNQGQAGVPHQGLSQPIIKQGAVDSVPNQPIQQQQQPINQPVTQGLQQQQPVTQPSPAVSNARDSSVKDRVKQAGQKVKEKTHNAIAGLKGSGGGTQQIKGEQAREKAEAYGQAARLKENQASAEQRPAGWQQGVQQQGQYRPTY
jgi:hypothetical protein